ncbi:hypothetical protein RD792_001075 [Penstemon davidsonii]|uniref:NAB domain-containing protein n=1 Tax=Penstemon davidsonii TaxID=160366 RepID=A0ABR0DMG2_9LAMI|nr:hypothetical protein RD792_001075 [Penstemon davidsonii]
MLQRAASNAYSWWWASHIRTKQSKWLDQSLQDMEEKVQSMLKLIEEDGDSFAKRAEMYYKRRPELISSVEEAYKAFRALADRYDLLSKDLQNANHTIATVFPEQVQFMDEDDESPTPKIPQIPGVNTGNVPKVPKAPIKGLKSLINTASQQLQDKKTSKEVEKSGLTKDEALEEIDKLQKEILGLQTVKEFVKSSYETGLAKYWGIENQIMEMQQKVCRLQDEFDVERVIEDDEARTLMAEAALKSCQEALALLQVKQDKSTKEAKEEYKKIEAASLRLKSLRKECLNEEHIDEEKLSSSDMGDVSDVGEETKEVETLKEISTISLTVTGLAEKIDHLVNKVISLETAVSSQTVLINTLRTEADDLQAQIRNLEDEKENLIDDTYNLSTRVKEMEEKLAKIQILNKNVETQNSNLQSNFNEARSSLDHLSEKLSSVKPDEEIEETHSLQDEEKLVLSTGNGNKKSLKSSDKEDKEEVKEVDMNVKQGEFGKTTKNSVKFLDQKPSEEVSSDHSSEAQGGGQTEYEDDMNWQQMLLSGMEDREKILLKEYTAILRNYKDVKKKLGDIEKKDRDSQFDITLQMRGLKKAILKRDEEIQNLRQKLNLNNGSEDLDKKEAFDDVSVTVDSEEDELTQSISIVEEKLRSSIDAILDENLDFWLRFSTSFHQIQKFKTEVQDLQDEISKLKEKKKQEGVRSEVRPIYKHLREIQTELTVWLDQSASLKDELNRRFESLCGIQEEITKSLKEGVEEDEIKFSSYQAARFQGEILNMKQENNKVREELQAGLDHVSTLQMEIEKTLRNLNEEFGISSDQPESKNRIPLRSFIFGTKPKKEKISIFSRMHHNRRYNALRGAVNMSNHS